MFMEDNMSKCYVAPYIMPSADLGKVNPLPDIKNISYIHAKIETTDNVPENYKKYINKGMISTMLPYCQQDGYNRDRKPREFNSVVVENEYLKAVFLPELGGRLWSLIDKEKNKELLYCNPVFQPGNLALRNAWFSGGVEFNVSIKGHNPLTCDSLFAQKITMPDGSEGVRMFEYERIRGVLYSIDAWIPKDSKFLMIRPKIENRTGKEIWMYWWSNIAVPAYKGIRVISPTKETFVNYFGNDHYILDYSNLPYTLDTDVSYPDNLTRSLDFFYNIPDKEEKWITSVDENGYGLFQCSTSELKGRKLFLWGQGEGGKNWNQFLSDGSNEGYVEIQAGLARTQLEHIPMSDGETWSWVEAYGAIDCGEKAHSEWEFAISTVEEEIAKHFKTGINNSLSVFKNDVVVTGEMFCIGSGWGALEEFSRKVQNLPTLSKEIAIPTESLTDAQNEWIDLYKTGKLVEKDVSEEPCGYVVDPFWHELLENSLEKEENRNWYALMHFGIMEYFKGNTENALSLFLESAEVKPNAWCFRNIAMIYRNEYKDIEKAYQYMKESFNLNKTCRGILVDTATTYLQAGKYTELLEAYEQIGNMQNDGRLKLCCVKALMALDRYEEAVKILNYSLEMPDIKEGDTAISDVWFDLYGKIVSTETGITDPKELKKLAEEKYPLKNLDFRTH